MNIKQEKLAHQIREFEHSDKNTSDYLDLILMAWTVLKPASGLIWSEVIEAINKSIPIERTMSLDEINEFKLKK